MPHVEFPASNNPSLTILVDEEDHEKVSKSSWCVCGCGYPEATINKKRTVLHKLIMPNVGDGLMVDHINRNRLDNRKENLRLVTPLQNSWNAGPTRSSPTGYRGVSKHGKTGKWVAKIVVNRKIHYGGIYATPEEAAVARDKMAIELCGDYAKLNFPGSELIPVDITIKSTSSKYSNVHYYKNEKLWGATITINKVHYRIKKCKTEHEAAVSLRKLIQENFPEKLEMDKFKQLPIE